MAFGLGELRLAPKEFWAMTPRELAAAAHHLGRSSVAPLTRVQLHALMTRYPDEEIGNG